MAMKKILFILCALVTAISVRAADPQAEAAVKRLGEQVKAMGDYHADFDVKAEGRTLRGSYAVSGTRFWMHTAAYDAMSDGRTRWEVNHGDKEVLIDRVDPTDGNVLSNPTRAFDFAPEAFDAASKNGNVVLTPRNQHSGLLAITLVLAPATGLPTEVRYRQEGLKDEVVVRIRKIAKGLPAGTAFSFDRTKYKGYEEVDFR